MDTICACCGETAAGFAMIGDKRYCHGDADGISCYELAQCAEVASRDPEFVAEANRLYAKMLRDGPSKDAMTAEDIVEFAVREFPEHEERIRHAAEQKAKPPKLRAVRSELGDHPVLPQGGD